MALKAMADNNIPIPVRSDAVLYDALAGKVDFVFKNIDEEFAITYSESSLKVKLGTGGCLICGRHVFNDSTDEISLVLSPNDSGYLVIRYDLTQSAGHEVSFKAVSALETGDLNNTGTKKDLVLGKYTTNENGVSQYTDLRSMRSNTVTINGEGWTNDESLGAYTIRKQASVSAIDEPVSAVIVPKKYSEAQTVQFEWGKIYNAETYDGEICFYANEVPTIEMTVVIKK